MTSRVFTRQPNPPIDRKEWEAHIAANQAAKRQYRLMPTAFTSRHGREALCKVCVDRTTRSADEVCGRCRREGRG